MAIVDKLNTFCSSTTTTGTATPAQLGDVIDLGAVRQGGGSEPLWLMIHFVTAGATTGTWWEVHPTTDADGTFAGSETTTIGHFRFLNAEQVAGTTYYRPLGDKGFLRYLGLIEVSSGTYGTKPVVTCALVTDPQTALQ